MIDLDLSTLPAAMVESLLKRGSAVPPLDWTTHADRAAKEHLDAIDDHVLLGVDAFRDEQMAAAARAVLYLWHGWHDDCRMYAQAARADESTYLAALCDRQVGRGDEVKAAFRRLGPYPTYHALAAFALQHLRVGDDAALDRFLEILSFGREWEPHAFTGLFEQARAGNVETAGAHAVRLLQCKEVELLLERCYCAATGAESITRRAAEPEKDGDGARRVRELRKRHNRPARLRDQQVERKHPGEAEAPRTAPEIPKSERVTIRCPGCRATMVLGDASRGSKVMCKSCGILFRVPPKTSAA